MTLLKLVFSLTLLCAVTGFPYLGKWSVAPQSVSEVSEFGSPGAGKNWLTPYVSLLSSVVPIPASPIPSEKPTRDTRSSEGTRTRTQKTGVLSTTRAGAGAGVYTTAKPRALPQRPSFCKSVVLKHQGIKVPLKKPTTGNIYKNKSHVDLEQTAAHSVAHAAVAAHSSSHHDGVLVSISNARTRGHPQNPDTPSRVDVCSSIWPNSPPRQRTEVDELFEYFSTYEVPETPKTTTPMTPVRPTPVRPTSVRPSPEAVVAECNLPPPYQNDRYDWLEVLAKHGGLPGCVNSTQQSPPQMPVYVMNDTCERPLPDNFSGETLYTFMQSDLRSFYRDETATLRFPAKPNQFLDIRGLLVWTSPPDDGNVYILEYFYDDSGLWLYIPDHTCKFVDTATLTCTTRQLCWCRDGKETCLAVQGLPGNLLATLVGGGR